MIQHLNAMKLLTVAKSLNNKSETVPVNLSSNKATYKVNYQKFLW